MISPKEFVAAVDDAQVIEAIRLAEKKTSCEFRVFVAQSVVAEPVSAAALQFGRLKMHQTRQRNAVLIFIAPKSQNFAIFADTAAHASFDQPTWDELAAHMSDHFKHSRYTDGLVHVLAALAEKLGTRFPSSMDSGNELADDVARDER